MNEKLEFHYREKRKKDECFGGKNRFLGNVKVRVVQPCQTLKASLDPAPQRKLEQ